MENNLPSQSLLSEVLSCPIDKLSDTEKLTIELMKSHEDAIASIMSATVSTLMMAPFVALLKRRDDFGGVEEIGEEIGDDDEVSQVLLELENQKSTTNKN